MSRHVWILGCALAVAASLAAATTAAAKTYEVEGRQIVTDEQTGAAKMRGGLIGKWSVTTFKEDKDPDSLLAGTGTEEFKGCLDARRDGSCKGDPKGTLSFSFEYWASTDGESVAWGSCYHPITAGTGGFSGAEGVLMMVDSPRPDGSLRTRYIGSITLDGGSAPARSAARRSC